MDRRIKREYTKHKKSPKWTELREKYLSECTKAKERYYENIVEDLKISNPSQWYSKLKRMSSHDQTKSEEPNVMSFLGVSDHNQAELIADQFSEISNQYEPLKNEDINLEGATNMKPSPLMEPYMVHQKIKKMKGNSATVMGDIPIKVIKAFGYELSFPLSNIYKRSVRSGEYPHIWKRGQII